jgi:hypothetical protein
MADSPTDIIVWAWHSHLSIGDFFKVYSCRSSVFCRNRVTCHMVWLFTTHRWSWVERVPNAITAWQWHDHGMELPKIPLPPPLPPVNFRYYPNIRLEGLRETTEHFRLDSVSRDWAGRLPLCMMLRWDGWGIICSIHFVWGNVTHIQNFDSEASRKTKLRPCLDRKMVLKTDCVRVVCDLSHSGDVKWKDFWQLWWIFRFWIM